MTDFSAVELLRQRTGAYSLGDNPSPDAREKVLRDWCKLLGEVDDITARLQRTELKELGFPVGELEATLSTRSRVSTSLPSVPVGADVDALRMAGASVLEAEDQLELVRQAVGQEG